MDKVILITGATSGFGRDVAIKLADENNIVYGAGRNKQQIEELSKHNVIGMYMDVTNDDSIKAVIDEIIRKHGHIDVLINNAGFGQFGMIEEVSDENIKYQFDVNVFGVARVNRHVLEHMRKEKHGRIIVTGSLVAYVSTPGQGWYAATKHALLAMTDALREEVRPLNISVTLINPGLVKTGFDEIALRALEGEVISDYTPQKKKIYNFYKEGFKNGASTDSTVNALYDTALTDNPKAYVNTTSDAKLLVLVKRIVGKRLFMKLTMFNINKSK